MDQAEKSHLTQEERVTIQTMLAQNNSPYAISIELGDKLPCSVTTLYRLIDACMFESRNIDLYEKVKRNPRKRD